MRLKVKTHLRRVWEEFTHPPGPHVWRWRMLQVWIIVFTVVVIILWRDNHNAITDLQTAKASVKSLQATNCGVKKFLIKAESARINIAQSEKGVLRTKDLQAAEGYYVLAKTFSAPACPVAIPIPPKK